MQTILRAIVRFLAPRVGLTVITYSTDPADEAWLDAEHEADPRFLTTTLH